MPARIAALPRARGYPVPWFVAWLTDGKPSRKGHGEPDFRILFPGAVENAWAFKRCWICGETLVSYPTFVVGPMCAVNRTSAEPPSHLDCARWSAIACPFLTRPHARRRENAIPEGAKEPAGMMIRRNPGVALLWTSAKPRVKYHGPEGFLFDLGDPMAVEWYAEGRAAERKEILDSIKSGIPLLRERAEFQGEQAIRALERETVRALKLVPA